jgi:hypothetical protein
MLKKLAVAVAGVALVLVLGGTVAAATAPSIYWKASTVAAALVSGARVTPHGPVISTEFPSQTKVQSASCSGVGKSKSGTYSAFACTMNWVNTADIHRSTGTTPLWVRVGYQAAPNGSFWTYPDAGFRVCSSKVALGACPPQVPAQPLANDPRLYKGILGYGPYGLARDATANELAKQMSVTLTQIYNGAIVNLTCTPTSAWTVYGCTFKSQQPGFTFSASTVTSVPHSSGWTTTVVLG